MMRRNKSVLACLMTIAWLVSDDIPDDHIIKVEIMKQAYFDTEG